MTVSCSVGPSSDTAWWSEGEAAVFDPSHYPEEHEERIGETGAELVGIFDTYAHADHVSGGHELANRNDVPCYLHPADALEIDATPVEDGEQSTIGSVDIEVIHTPGHGVWIAFPLFLVTQGSNVAQVGVVVGVHSAAYFLHVYTSRLGNQVGRKPPIVAGFSSPEPAFSGWCSSKGITRGLSSRESPASEWRYTTRT